MQHCLFAYNKRGDVASEQRPCSKLECAPQPSGGWSQWNDCSRKCGGGEKMRFRICNNCYQLSFETVSCNEQPCTDKDYHWEEWSSWTGCDDCEVEKFVSRRRNCVGGFPGDCRRYAQQCDKSIVDLEFQTKPCNKLVCKNIITHQWSEWGSWHRCSASCDEGYRIRYRTCSGGNLGCGFHLSFSFQKCNISPCEAKNKQWSSWTVVGDCSATCGIGLVVKVRRCLHASNTCPGKSVDTRDCNNNQIPCPKAQADNQANSTGPLGMFNKIAITVPNYFCNDSNNAVWTFGYLNNDERYDLICKRDTNLEASYSRSSTIFENIDWRQDLSKCTQGDMYLADFNGDIQDDFVCQNKRNKVLTINLWANERFSSDPLYEGEFCTGEDDRVMFLDANGDRKNDILCDHGRFNGYAILNLYDAT